jgi:hypothetical protein
MSKKDSSDGSVNESDVKSMSVGMNWSLLE